MPIQPTEMQAFSVSPISKPLSLAADSAGAAPVRSSLNIARIDLFVNRHI